MNTKILLITLFATILGCAAQTRSQRINDYKAKIIGVWVAEDDPNYKIEFNSQGQQREYISGVLQNEIYEYELLFSCSSASDNGYDIYLKRRDINDSANDFSCEIVNNISNTSSGVTLLSITSERGKLEKYIKQ